MYKYDKKYIAKIAVELGFVRDTLEKVYRLADILEYLNTDPILKDNLALKGGTAINLTVFNLPRLSVDIDLDYLGADSREEMLAIEKLLIPQFQGLCQLMGTLLVLKQKIRIVLIRGFTIMLI